MKKTAIFLLILITFVLSGCSEKVSDLNNLEETYTTVVSLPYSQLIGKSVEKISDDAGKLTYDEEAGIYYSDKKLMEFVPYFIADDKDTVKVSGFETIKNVDDDLISYISGLYNIMCSYHGNVALDPDIKDRVAHLDNISKCKDGAFFEEKWNKDGFPVEMFVFIKDNKAIIRMQYNKMPNL